MMDTQTTYGHLRMVEGGSVVAPRPQTVPQSARRSARDARWLDWLPMILLGASGGVAGVVRIIQAASA